MRVDMLTKEYPPEVYGGAGVHVTELVAQLRSPGRVTLEVTTTGAEGFLAQVVRHVDSAVYS